MKENMKMSIKYENGLYYSDIMETVKMRNWLSFLCNVVIQEIKSLKLQFFCQNNEMQKAEKDSFGREEEESFAVSKLKVTERKLT